jgi:dTDP-4-dehydrorhamnose reductase
MRAWITGTAGLLGTALVPYLTARGWQVVAAPGRMRAGQTVDLTDAATVARELDAARPDIVVNLAALTDVDYCEKNPQETYRVNAAMVAGIAQWVAGHGVRFVHISTDQVYDGAGPHDETTVSPINFYAYSKCLSEAYVALAGGTSLRTNFFGRSALAGRASFSDWVVNSLREGREITVFEDSLVSPLSIDSLVEAIERVMCAPVAGTFNLGSDNGMSKADIAFRLAAAAGLDTRGMRRGAQASLTRAARRPGDMRMNSEKFFRVFGGRRADLATEIDRVGREYRNEAS